VKLSSLSIRNYRAISSLDLSFEARPGRVRPVTVLAGPNGCGKTSVLFGVVQTLRLAMQYRTDDVPGPSEFDIHLPAPMIGWSSKPPEASVELSLVFEQSELEAIPQVFRDTADPQRETRPGLADLGDGNVVVKWVYPPPRRRDGTPNPDNHLSACAPRDALPWLLGRAKAIRGWRERKLQDPTLVDRIGGLRIFPQDRNLRERVVGAADFPLGGRSLPGDADALGEEAVTRGASASSVADILKYLWEYANARGEDLPPDRNWDQRIRDLFRRICAPKEYAGYLFRGDELHGAPCFREGDTIYPLHMAASGEQVIIEYVTRLTYPTPLNNSIILIDEPEMHLHPVWLRRLYRALPQLGDNNQFILTTHSPELRSLALQDGALVEMGELGGEE